MAKIDDTVFTVQIKAVNTILQLCYTLTDYVKQLIDSNNGAFDDIDDINTTLESINSTISEIQEDVSALNTGKLNKVDTTSTVMQAYVKQPNGSQQMIDVHWNSNADTIPIRDQTGNIRVALIPTNNSHASSKQYTDTGDLFENIKDSNGNMRFIEGAVDTQSITGIVYDYAKWSLSGTHLMIVLAGHTTASTGFSNYQDIASVVLPQYIRDKIYTLYDNNVLRNASMTFVNATGGTGVVSFQIGIIKNSTGLLLQNINAGTITTDKVFRLQIDLLIDNS